MDILLNTPPLNVFEHMALDEQMVYLRPRAVTLRFYNWLSGSAVTFGYAQFSSEVKKTLALHHFSGAYTRRPTGGGIVFHTDDLTFSLVFPSQERPAEIYRKFHAFIFNQLSHAGVPGRMMADKLPASAYAPSINHEASACFIRPVENDLLADDGHKILGGAIRRFEENVLYQGSLQLPHARQNPLLKRAVIEAVRSFLAVDLRPLACCAGRLDAMQQHAVAQYQSSAWVEKF